MIHRLLRLTCRGFLLAAGIAATSRLGAQGVTFTPVNHNLGNAGITTPTGIAYGQGLFVMATRSSNAMVVATSPNGLDWTARTITVPGLEVPFQNVATVRFFPTIGRFVIHTNGLQSGITYSSPDGVTWTALPDANAGSTIEMVSDGQRLLGVGANNLAIGTLAGALGNWAPVNTTLTGAFNYLSAAYGGGRWFVTADSGGGVATSVDGVNWSAVPALGTLGSGRMVYGAGRWVFHSPSSASTSTDGVNFQGSLAVPLGSHPTRFVNGRFLALTGSNVQTSTDGVAWSAFGALPGAVTVVDVAFGAGRYVVVGTNLAVAQIWTALDPTGGPTPPSVTTQPASAVVPSGGSATFTVAATGSAPLGYQWRLNGVPIPGAVGTTLQVANARAAEAGTYDVVVTNDGGSVVSSPATLTVQPPPRLVNLSVRAPLADGQAIIGGFVVNGASRPILVRAAGPGLTGQVATPHPDPRVDLYNAAGALVEQNNNWSSTLASTFANVGAFPFTTGSLDGALLRGVGGPHTAIVSGAGTGVVLLEVYDAGTGDTPRLVNLAARGRVGTGENVLIAGFVVRGQGTTRLLIRGLGPKLSQLGVTGVLADPLIQVFSGQTSIAQNDNWPFDLLNTFTAIGAQPLDVSSRDSAVLVTLTDGAYTAILSGVGGGTGEGLIEVYEVP